MTDAALPHRWWIVAIFVLSTAINYLDRQVLAAVAPLIKTEFDLSYTDYGLLVAAVSVTYAAGAPFAGAFIDRVGLNRGIALAIALWSAAGMATAFTQSLAGLVACRALLGLAESGGIPAAGKAIHLYLKPAERALGNGLNQAGVSLGLIAATPLGTWLALRYNWRAAFLVTGALGFLWIPLWMAVARRDPPGRAAAGGNAAILRDRRTWLFMLANALSMVVYSLWTNMTTLYLVDALHLTLRQAAWFAWIPALFALLGGFAGGWLSLRYIRGGMAPLSARRRVCLAAALAGLPAAALPLLTSPGLATAGISLGLFAIAAFSVNMYSMPLDAFGTRAAFAVSMLVASYGAVQAVVSPLFGRMIDLWGFGPVCVVAAFMPLAGYAVLRSKAVQ